MTEEELALLEAEVSAVEKTLVEKRQRIRKYHDNVDLRKQWAEKVEAVRQADFAYLTQGPRGELEITLARGDTRTLLTDADLCFLARAELGKGYGSPTDWILEKLKAQVENVMDRLDMDVKAI